MAKDETTESQNQTEDTSVADSPTNDDKQPSGSSPEPGSEDRGLSERLRRLEERNSYLEETHRLLMRQQEAASRPVKGEDPLPEDLAELDKTLAPLIDRRTKQVTENLSGTLSQLYDEVDAAKFDTYLQRNYRDILSDEDEYAKVAQKVEAVRRAASQRGQWVSRIDAFMYNTGLETASEKRKTAKQAREEAKRKASVKVAGSGEGKPAEKKPDSATALDAEIAEIRSRAQKGERLTAAERTKWADWMEKKKIRF